MRFSSFEEIVELCRTRVPEALQLEFKEKTSPDRAALDNGDKKLIAKAVSAFANSGGGTLVLGVRTTRIGELDVADSVMPIAEPESCRAEVDFVCKTNVSPAIAALVVTALTGPDGKGVIVCEVPASELRPHMSTAPGVHTYYRRTFQGDVPMTPFEVQEQVLAVREAALNPTIKIGAGSIVSTMSHWIAVGYGVNLGIENVGSRACLNPFLRVRSSERSISHNATFSARLGMWKSDAPFGTIIHVDDSRPFITLQFVSRVFPNELALAKNGTIADLLAAVHLYGGKDDLHSKTVTDKKEIESLTFEINYGAENSASRKRSFEFNRDEIAAQILLQLGENIRERTIGEVGVWRDDLIAELRELYRG